MVVRSLSQSNSQTLYLNTFMNVQKCRDINIMNNLLISLVCILAATHSAEAQDPADGWMAYAVGAVPSGLNASQDLK